MKKLKELIKNKSTERVIQKYLKSNLHLIAEHYASSENEYIIFSEFPIDEGKVDFVIFTDRSRMQIILIEIKGADFPYLTKSNKTSNVIRDAHEQILERFDFINHNYELFRRKVHEIRQEVEKGEIKYNSLLGSNGFLHVDPNKEIKYRGIVIGGYTTDDILESKKRNQLELDSNLKIQFESWDSFLRKVENKNRIKMTNFISTCSNKSFPIGTRVKTKIAWPSVPIGTEGIVDEHYGNGGIMVAWDLPSQPLPHDYKEFNLEKSVRGILRDGFSESETKYLEIIKRN
ncbi:Shedu immune nuclease family protein [Nitratifractor salsuginis]|uniref:Shedu protein SduA C-terminal domain-containing protein n=1 Tax=Nitratifractor salsuginis (strain DSM 16511 / JCM 12458 / E9I37-1) TaxID=749222 RepID=E6X243_NITSE|nr:Shedu immune nuclease family protein [Nitratifractor salsuginis]ADV47112.1 hypothetical protein Nitsa_1867 [Nitratifractor salsuginis DSM 16511]